MPGWKDKAKDLASKGAELAKEQYETRQAGKAEEQASGEEPMMTVVSHDEGKNAVVSLYPNRIERVQEKGALSLSRANQDAEVIPLSRVNHVRVKKAGFRSNVIVQTGGEDIVFRVSHDEAKAFSSAVTQQLLAKEAGPGAAPAPAAAAGDDTADQLRKLAELRDQGILTEDEFAAKKKQILGL